jgi:hypothetical protein
VYYYIITLGRLAGSGATAFEALDQTLEDIFVEYAGGALEVRKGEDHD